jgi:hypothetical protein
VIKKGDHPDCSTKNGTASRGRRMSRLFATNCGGPLLVALCAPAAFAQQPAQAPVVHASIDRTAVWVADRVNYAVEIVCPKGVDILSDDVAKEKLKTTGLDVVGMNATATTAADESTTHRIVYALTTYHVDTPDLRIDTLAVRYFVKRPGQRLQDEAPAGDFQIPAVSIAFRSTLSNDPSTAALRDGVRPRPRRPAFAAAGAIGVALMLISIAPLAFVAVAALGRRRPRRQGRSVRQMRQEERLTMETLQTTDVSTLDGRRRAYDGIDAVVRAHLRDAFAVPGPSLTPAEVPARLDGRKLRVPSEQIAALLSECEHARYAPPGTMPSADACREAIDQARAVVG